MIQPKEPLEKLLNQPVIFTKNKNFLPPEKIKIYDDTLRDGEQMPGVAFSPEQKLEFAKLLFDTGVSVMDVGFPVVSETDKKALQLIVLAKKNKEIPEDAEILAMCRSTKKDIDAVIEAMKEINLPPDCVTILILSQLSDLHIKYNVGKILLKQENIPLEHWLEIPVEFYRQANIKLITQHIQYAKEKGIKFVEFSGQDGSRADLNYCIEWGKKCIEAGGDRLCFSDTVGCLTPEGVDHYIPPLVDITVKKGIQLHIHFHNDLGAAAINCVRGLSWGASHPGVTVCGIGERAGNAPLEHVVMQLKLLYGIELPNFKYENLVLLRKTLEKFSGISIQPHWPVVGEGVFYHESGIHTSAIAIHPAIYQFIPENIVGGRRKFIFGKHSGGAAVEEVLKNNQQKLKEYSIEITPQLITKILNAVKEIRQAKTDTNLTEKIISSHYKNYYELGIQEEEVIDLAIKIGKNNLL